MKNSLFATSALVAALAALPAAAQDWSGFYGGLNFGGNLDGSGTVTPSLISNIAFSDGQIGGLFAGYNFQNGNLVYGVEAGFESASIVPDGTSIDGFEQFADLRFRLGYASGKVLAYGAIGYTQAKFSGLNETIDMTGLNFGLGADFKVSDQFFIGAEYMFRDLDGSFSSPPGTLETRTSAVMLRVGMTF